MAFRGYWDATEEQALRDAVQKHGIGAWEKMRHDVDFKVLKCVPSRARARNSSATARSSAARFPPSFHAADARGTRANADNSRFSSQWRGTTDAREEFFAATRFLRGECALGGARGRAAERAGRRLNAHTARRRRAHPAHLLPIPDPYRHRGRTGVQLKDKWRNLIKFQHLRRGEAESAPYKGGARGAAPASAGKRKKGEDDRYASCKPRATEHHARGGRSGVARERRAAARRARGPRQFSRWRDGTHTAAARFPRRVRVSRAVSGFRGLAGQDDDVFFFFGKNANERRARLARDSPPICASPPTPISHNSETATGGKKKATGVTGKNASKKEPTKKERKPRAARTTNSCASWRVGGRARRCPPGSTRPRSDSRRRRAPGS
jgi:hypothetical protein